MKKAPDSLTAARRELNAAREDSGHSFAKRLGHLDAARRHLADMRTDISGAMQSLAPFFPDHNGQILLLSLVNHAVERCWDAVQSLDVEIRRAEVDLLTELERRARCVTSVN